ncbi:GMC family oxidoreductase [Kiloniella laminariae]|uniref:GMC family oxidoreductase n=1 Tax=Kiloniella laminariae TaxID=454162 RepID=UPI00036DBC0F|nr:GMC family oxidoreductase [Kiloniella laminariae]
MAEDNKMNADVVIIGAGMAGAHLARSLREKGIDVLILEAGDRRPRGDFLKIFYESTTKGPQAPYPSIPSAPHPTDGGYADFYVQDKDTANENKFIGAYLRIFGGTTWHWTGFADRLRPEDFRMKTLYGVAEDWPIDYDLLLPYYKTAEERWGVAGDPNDVWGAPRHGVPYEMPPIPATYMDKQVTKALEKMKLTSGIFSHARNSQIYDNRPVCCGNNTCVPICPIGAKYDASVDAQKAEDEGARVEVNALVTFIKTDKDRKITRVKVQKPDGSTFWVGGKVFALCAHAIENPRLLLNSKQENAPKGIANSSDAVGRYLLTQANQDTQGLTPDPVFPYRGPQQTSGLVERRDGAFRSKEAAIGTSFMNSGWSGNSDATNLATDLIAKGVVGPELSQQINARVSRHLRLNSSAEVLPDANNRVELADEKDTAGIPKPKITFKMDDYTKNGLKVGLDINLEVFKLMGATEVTHNTPYLSNAIIGGTTKMGDDPKTSVVNADLVSHDHHNLYIIGSSTHITMPVNAPSLTIAALAIRAAEHMEKKLKS